MAESAGLMIGGYTVERELGEGGMGRVYLARQARLGRLVAVKVLHPDLADDEVYVERFEREAVAAAAFVHPNVVGVIEAGCDEASGDRFIAFEYVEGPSLQQMLELEPLSERRALEVARGVARALAYSEAKGIVHRDLKPENVLIAPDGTAKLADLGLAKRSGAGDKRLTQTGHIVGTPLYMAPEQALGRVEVDGRADLYALGLCLWASLTGLVPFDEDGRTSSLQVLSRHINEDLPDVRARAPHVSEGTARVIATLSARDRDARYASAAAALEDIERVLAGERPRAGVPERDTRKLRAPSGRLQRGTSSPEWTPVRAAEPGLGKGAVAFAVLSAVVLLGTGVSLLGPRRERAPELATLPGRDAPGSTSGPAANAAWIVEPEAPALASTPASSTEPAAALAEPSATGAARSEPRASGGEHRAPRSSGREPPPDLEELELARAAVARVSRLLLEDVRRGRAALAAFAAAAAERDEPELARFVTAMRHAAALGRAREAGEVRAAAEALRTLEREGRRVPLPGKLALAVDAEVAVWAALASGAERLHLAMSDPRAQVGALAALAPLPPERRAGLRAARALLELADTVDLHARWRDHRANRAAIAARRPTLRAEVEGTALAGALGAELEALDLLLGELLDDPAGSLLGAVAELAPATAARSAFVSARRVSVPPGAGISRLSGHGVAVQLTGPWPAGARFTLRCEGGGPELAFDEVGVSWGGRSAPVTWPAAPRVLVEARPRGLLVRLPGAVPGELEVPAAIAGASAATGDAFAARAEGLEAAWGGLWLLRLPPRGPEQDWVVGIGQPPGR